MKKIALVVVLMMFGTANFVLAQEASTEAPLMMKGESHDLKHAAAIDADSIVNPQQLLEKADAVLRGKSHEMHLFLDVKNGSREHHYELKVWMKGVDQTFARVLGPAKVQGQTFLRLKARLWQYLPTAERTILIPPSLMLNRFMGSDFSNDDFVKMSYYPRDYAAKIVGEETVDGTPVYHLELTPHPDAPVTYGKLEMWVRKSDAGPVRVDFYDEHRELIRRLHYSEYKMMGSHEAPAVWHMENMKETDRETTVRIQSGTYDIEIDDAIFNRENLEKTA